MARAMLIIPPQEPMRDELVERLGRLPGLQLTLADDEAAAMPAIAEQEILFTFAASRRLLEAAPALRWIQALISGVDMIALDRAASPLVALTNAHGIHGHAVSESALGLMFALARDHAKAMRQQAERSWTPWTPRLLAGGVLVIVGVGAIAEVLAGKCQALGMRVEGVTGSVRTVPGFDVIHPRGDLHRALGGADVVVLLAPNRPENHHMIDAAALAAMQPSAFLINVGRGVLVDDDALLGALRAGRIAGAALDAVNGEPLGPASPYWDAPNVLLTPHISGRNTHYVEDLMGIVEVNLRCFIDRDAASMINLVV